MAPSIGDRLGPDQIVEQIGAGLPPLAQGSNASDGAIAPNPVVRTSR